MAMVTIFCPWEAVFSWALPSALPSALASPPTAAVPVAAGALVSLGAEGAEQAGQSHHKTQGQELSFLLNVFSLLYPPFYSSLFGIDFELIFMYLFDHHFGVQGVPGSVSQEIDTEHGYQQGQTGRKPEPRSLGKHADGLGIIEDVSPGCLGRLDPIPKS